MRTRTRSPALYCLIFALLMLLPWAVWAGNTHPGADPDKETNIWFGEAWHGYVVSGCLPATSLTTALTVPACRGYTVSTTVPTTMTYSEEASAKTFTLSGGDGTYWLVMHRSTAASIGGWTRVAGTHYLWKVSTARPATPAGTTDLARIVVASNVITTVYDLRNGRPDTYEIDVTAPLYGAKGDGVTDDSAAFTAACNAVRNRWYGYSETHPTVLNVSGQQQVIRIPGGKTYFFSDTWDCNIATVKTDLVQVTFEAQGANFLTNTDMTLIDFSPNTTCIETYDGQGLPTWGIPYVRKIWWHGGNFVGPGVTAVNSKMMRGYAVRGLYVDGIHAGSFHTLFDVCVQDNFHLRDSRMGPYVYGIHQGNATTLDLIKDDGGRSSTIWDISKNNFASGLDCTAAIAILGGAPQNFTLTYNSISGRCSSGWLTMVTGQSDLRSNQSINIVGNTHEQAAVSGGYGYRIRRRGGMTARTVGVVIQGNEMRFSSTDGFTAMELTGVEGAIIQGNFIESQNATNWVGIQLEDVASVTAGGNYFETSNGAGGVCWKLLGTNARVHLGTFNCGEVPPIHDTAGGIAKRWQYTAGERWRMLTGDHDILGTNNFDGDANMTPGSVTVDMNHNSNLGSDFAGGQGVVPWGYFVRVQLRDTLSVTGTVTSEDPSPAVMIAQSAAITNIGRFICSAASFPNNGWVSCDGLVRADVNGDLYVTTTKIGDLRVKIAVLAVIQ